ncbi:MAG: serine acetyltransferase [Oligoflexia bacterium]|nr:serine acetyltransferase [Oligoflexia bacterium]MBF0366754.1 serine acetyltransferase [Oligoflexia bacterium]
MIHDFLLEVFDITNPEFSAYGYHNENEIYFCLEKMRVRLLQILMMFNLGDVSAASSTTYSNYQKNVAHYEKIADKFFREFEEILDLLDKDAEAILNGDPAANTIQEVVTTYPGFFAIAIHRVAHFFYKQELRTLARIMSEYAHQLTGIDIHPGAKIGESFCIDHGTGVVVGETTIVGKNVKIFQGVTFGALSVKKHLQNLKRHPTIEDNCVIYSSATILGGETVIGANTIVGGNVWLTHSVPANSIVTNKSEIKMVSHQEKKLEELAESHEQYGIQKRKKRR